MEDLTLEEVLRIVSFDRDEEGTLYVNNVWGNVAGNVRLNVGGNVGGNVLGDVGGSVWGTINGRWWVPVETPKDKAIRLIREGKGEEAIKVLQETKS